VFQQITEVFGLKHLIGSAPGATVFQASLCLVIYNLLQLVRGSGEAGRPDRPAVAELSTDKIFADLHEQLVSLHTVLQPEEWLSCLAVPTTAEQMQERLGARLGGTWSPRWRKATNKKPRPHPAKVKQAGAHTSVHKILQEAKQAKQQRKVTPPRRQ
jgi:hypothetical protein